MRTTDKENEMTTTKIKLLQHLFKAQLDTGKNKIFYMTVQGGPEIAQIEARVHSHDITTDTWDNLLASLQGYKYQDTISNGSWPRFAKDTV